MFQLFAQCGDRECSVWLNQPQKLVFEIELCMYVYSSPHRIEYSPPAYIRISATIYPTMLYYRENFTVPLLETEKMDST